MQQSRALEIIRAKYPAIPHHAGLCANYEIPKGTTTPVLTAVTASWAGSNGAEHRVVFTIAEIAALMKLDNFPFTAETRVGPGQWATVYTSEVEADLGALP